MDKNRIFYAIFIALILICGIIYNLSLNNNRADAVSQTSELINEPSTQETTLVDVACKMIYVQLSGQVNNPGVYQLKEGSRIFEAIRAAGGLKKGIVDCPINQARVVRDGEMIYIPSNIEASNYIKENSDSELININTATKQELMTLPGIGESKALSIIEYRENNNGFSTIEDIMKVGGIKQAMFDKIKEHITN